MRAPILLTPTHRNFGIPNFRPKFPSQPNRQNTRPKPNFYQRPQFYLSHLIITLTLRINNKDLLIQKRIIIILTIIIIFKATGDLTKSQFSKTISNSTKSKCKNKFS